MFQLSLIIDRNIAEAVTDALEQAGAMAVSLADARDDAIYEPAPGQTPLWARTQVFAWFDRRRHAASALTDIKAFLGALDGTRILIEPIPDQDWVLAGGGEPRVLCFGNRLWVVPPEQADEYRNVPHVLLTPGLAFGTGTHPTTALCLEWLSEHSLRGKTVVDYGCGSGILGIAALKLGAARVIAVDHHDQAITSTRSNAEQNRVDTRLIAMAPAQCEEKAVDIIIANILLNPLITLAPRFAGMLNPRARVVLSGVMTDQVQTLADVYAAWFVLEAPRLHDNWVCIAGRARA